MGSVLLILFFFISNQKKKIWVGRHHCNQYKSVEVFMWMCKKIKESNI